MSKIVISQPFFLPWVGLFEQLRQADVFVHYNDVQYSKGGFMNRVQVKTSEGFKWLTIPLKKFPLGTLIKDIEIDDSKNWKTSHLDILKQLYSPAPCFKEMLTLAEHIYQSRNFTLLSEFVIYGIEETAKYFDLYDGKKFFCSSDIQIIGKSTERVLQIVKHFNATSYITGMGALKYFDFELFEQNSIGVYFLNYQKIPYTQLYGKFNPYVSIFDLIACHGKEGAKYICSGLEYWKDFQNSDAAKQYLRTIN